MTGIYPRSVSGAGKECFPWTRVTNEVSACACRGRVYYTWECPGKSGVCWWRRGSTMAGYTKGSRGVPRGGRRTMAGGEEGNQRVCGATVYYGWVYLRKPWGVGGGGRGSLTLCSLEAPLS